MTDDFAQQYLGEFSTMEMPLDEKMAIYYHVRCENYDRMICRARDAWGDAKVTRPWELSNVNQHAEWVIREILRAYPELPNGRLRYAIRKYGERYTPAALEEMWAKIEAEQRSRLADEVELIRQIIGVDISADGLCQLSSAEEILRKS
jgi:hypothetical protein